MLEMLTASTFMLLDSLFYEALDLIRRHAKIDYLTTGKHDLLLQIKGLFVKKYKILLWTQALLKQFHVTMT